jgi:hypothetical protein
VVVPAGDDDVVVDATPLVDVVVLPPPEVVVLDEGTVVVVDELVVVDVVGVDVVVVVVATGGGRVVGVFSKIFSTVVPPLPRPKRSASGRPAMSSTTVTRPSETKKTAITAPIATGHRNVCAVPDGWVAPGSTVPTALVPRSRSRSPVCSGVRTTACLTALFVRSIDSIMRAVPVVAATEPMATPTMVPLTPKTDATTAESTAPPAEARICRYENFTPVGSPVTSARPRPFDR